MARETGALHDGTATLKAAGGRGPEIFRRAVVGGLKDPHGVHGRSHRALYMTMRPTANGERQRRAGDTDLRRNLRLLERRHIAPPARGEMIGDAHADRAAADDDDLRVSDPRLVSANPSPAWRKGRLNAGVCRGSIRSAAS